MSATAERSQGFVIFDAPEREMEVLLQYIRAKAAGCDELQILEAGCGTCWELELADVPHVLTGIDINADALSNRKFQKRDLHEAVLGDLRTVCLEKNKYDVIYSSFVLEHISNVDIVLDNFVRWLSPGGLLIVRIPDRQSVYGYLSRLTPFWLHVFYKRFIEGRKTAGKPGHDPFPVVYDDVVSRQGIHDWCDARGLAIHEEIGWSYPLSRWGFLLPVITGVMRLVEMLSLGRLTAGHINLAYVIEKPMSDVCPSVC